MNIEERIELIEKAFEAIKKLCNSYDEVGCDEECPFSNCGECLFYRDPIGTTPCDWNVEVRNVVKVSV